MSDCKQCGKAIDAVMGELTVAALGKKAVYCSRACKQKAYRKRNAQPGPSVTRVTVEEARNICETGDPNDPGQEGTAATPGKRSSSTGDPRDTKSRETVENMDNADIERRLAAIVEKHGLKGDQPTSQCHQESGIPLPGDPGYKGVVVGTPSRWILGPGRPRMTRAEMLTRYALG